MNLVYEDLLLSIEWWPSQIDQIIKDTVSQWPADQHPGSYVARNYSFLSWHCFCYELHTADYILRRSAGCNERGARKSRTKSGRVHKCLIFYWMSCVKFTCLGSDSCRPLCCPSGIVLCARRFLTCVTLLCRHVWAKGFSAAPYSVYKFTCYHVSYNIVIITVLPAEFESVRTWSDQVPS